MSLQLIQTVNVTSSTSSTTVSGIYDEAVYVLFIEGLNYSSDTYSRMRVVRTSDSSVLSGSSYNWSYNYLRSDTGFAFSQSSSNNAFDIGSTSDAGQNATNMIVYLYNFYDSNKMPTMHSRHSHRQAPDYNRSFSGYGMYRVAESCNGVNVFGHASNHTGGRLSLFRIS